MDLKYNYALLDSIYSYLFNLQYLAKDNPNTLRDLHLIEILLNMYDESEWYEISERDVIQIQRTIDKVIFRNSDIQLPTIINREYYSNVNTPQNIWTWQRVYDNLDINNIIQTILYETGEEILFENGNNLIFEDLDLNTYQYYLLDESETQLLLENDNILILETYK